MQAHAQVQAHAQGQRQAVGQAVTLTLTLEQERYAAQMAQIQAVQQQRQQQKLQAPHLTRTPMMNHAVAGVSANPQATSVSPYLPQMVRACTSPFSISPPLSRYSNSNCHNGQSSSQYALTNVALFQQHQLRVVAWALGHGSGNDVSMHAWQQLPRQLHVYELDWDGVLPRRWQTTACEPHCCSSCSSQSTGTC